MRNMGIIETHTFKHLMNPMKSSFSLQVALAAAALAFTVSASQATILDLMSNGEGTVNGAVFQVTAQHPVGTGVFDPFLTVQNSPWEQGYNGSNGNFDTKRVPQWNHEIKFSDLSQTTINGIAYFGFVVDVNEPNGGPQAGISLDGLKIFTSPTLQTSTSVDANGVFNGSLGILRYDLGANTVLYNDQHSGSGTADISIFIPVSDFAGTNPNDYVYMYQAWGSSDMSEGGFEETAMIAGAVPVPEVAPSSILFGFLGLVVAASSRRALGGRVRALVRHGK